MGKKRVYTTTEVSRNRRLFQTAVPFDVTLNGKIICSVVKPMGIWRECENCGENTKNILEFKDDNAIWQKIILCDKCSEQLL